MILDIILQHMYDINGWLISQHEGILFSLIIKSIKATSMLERLDRSFALVILWGVHGVSIFIIITVWSVE